MSGYEGPETLKLLDKLNKEKRLKEIADRLRSATGYERVELLEEREKLKER